MNKCQSISAGCGWIAFTLIALLILLIYSNTFHASWHFDDKPNIVNNTYLHLTDLKPESLIRTLYTNPSHPSSISRKMNRPVAFLTFAVNWYFCRENVTGYHVVNITIHILTAFFLYFTILNLCKSPNIQNSFQDKAHFIALLSAVLWAVNPIQTQAVTYIVQRLASLAAMFYLLSIYFYIKTRIAATLPARFFFSISCVLSFILALGTKENAATLPLSLLLLEMIFFQDMSQKKTRQTFIIISGGFILLFLMISLHFLSGTDLFFSRGYDNRTFTITERFLTEFRIVIFYLSQIFYPVASRFSIDHDVMLSTSLFAPWTTLPAIFAVLALITTGCCLIKKMPVLAFSILFFFLNHLIESTILPLELVFEHRNYLPSLFLFFPVAVGIKRLMDYYRKKNISMQLILIAFVALLLMGVGISTYIRNLAWATEISLWEDAMQKAPGRARPLTVLAFEWSQSNDPGKRNDDVALRLYEKSLSLEKSRKNVYPSILNNMARIYARKGDFPKAVELFTEALTIDPDYDRGRFGLIQIQIILGRWEEASKNADRLVSNATPLETHLNMKGFLLLKQKKYEAALHYFQKSLKLAPNFSETLLYMGAALSLTENYERADWFLRRAYTSTPDDITPLMCLIENSIKAGDTQKAEHYADNLIDSYSLLLIKYHLEKLQYDNLSLSISPEPITQIIAKRLTARSREIADFIYP